MFKEWMLTISLGYFAITEGVWRLGLETTNYSEFSMEHITLNCKYCDRRWLGNQKWITYESIRNIRNIYFTRYSVQMLRSFGKPLPFRYMCFWLYLLLFWKNLLHVSKMEEKIASLSLRTYGNYYTYSIISVKEVLIPLKKNSLVSYFVLR